jgi:hypothetical protein
MRIQCDCPSCQRLREFKAEHRSRLVAGRPPVDQTLPHIHPDAEESATVICYLFAAFVLAALAAIGIACLW